MRLAPDGNPVRTIAISGATGLIGSALVARLRTQGHTVRRLVRASGPIQPGDVPWDPSAARFDPRALEGCDAIVQLAGSPIAERWSSARKREIRASRVQGTQLLARTVAVLDRKPEVVLSGSAVGFYGNRGDEILGESSRPGSDFLATVTREWEAAAEPMAAAGVRLVLLRTGIVLSRHGGALAKLLTPFRLGLGGPIGSGRQYMSWIALEDHLRAMEFALATPALNGPANFVSPHAVTNSEFADALGRVLHRPAILPLPAFALELVFGEMARATLLAGQRAMPGALLDAGFAFATPTLDAALQAVLQAPG